MCSARDNAALPALGCPIRESAGQRPFSASSWLIAAVHALHRLLVPRHPPYALDILTVIFLDLAEDSLLRRGVLPRSPALSGPEDANALGRANAAPEGAVVTR